jgi:hypothetical protein
MCPREIDPKFNKETDAVSLSLTKVKELFDKPFVSQLDSMFMCGNYGDPAAAPECIQIFEYFRTVNPNIVLGMHSNGGLRSKRWWSTLGSILSREHDYCFFGIDGLHDTNHIHRVNTDFNKIIENATSFIEAGGKAHWEFLIFEHNEHQVEEAKRLSEQLGFTNFRTKISRRLNWSTNKNIKPPKGIYND